jgi:hypothetical protein
LYAGLDAVGAAALASQVFHVDDTSAETMPIPAGSTITGYVGSHYAQLQAADGSNLLAFSPTPWRVNDGGGLGPVSLALTGSVAEGGFEPVRGAVEASFPASATGVASLPDGVTITDGGASAQPGSVVGDRVFYANTGRTRISCGSR